MNSSVAKQSSPGARNEIFARKWVLGLRVIRAGNGKPGLARGMVKNLLRSVDGLPAFHTVGIILILRSPEKARFGDRVAGTRGMRY